MVQIEILEIYDKGRSFVIEYEEKDTRKRNRHAFPKKRGWCEKDPKGNPYFIERIKKKIKEERANDTSEIETLSKLKGSSWEVDEE